MNEDNLKICERLISSTYVRQGTDARKTLENRFRTLLEQVVQKLLFTIAFIYIAPIFQYVWHA